METTHSLTVATIIGLLDKILEVSKLKSYVPHSQIRPILESLAESSHDLEGVEDCKIIVICIDTLCLLEPMLKGEKGVHVLGSICALAVYISQIASNDLLKRETPLKSFATKSAVVQVYLSMAATFAMEVLIVVTTENISLPTLLADGTPIVQINLSEPARVVPAPPGMSYASTAKTDDSNIGVTVKAVEKQFRARKNVVAVTASFVRGAWTILVGIVGKGFVPCGDTLLPKRFHSYPIVVCEYRFIPLNRQRWLADAPQPQIGGAIAPAAHICRMGTMGPAVELGDGRAGFLSSAHIFKDCTVGERVVLPGMVARALSAIATGGGGRDPLTTFNNFRGNNKITEEAVQRVQEAYPAYMPSIEEVPLLEFATLVAINPAVDIAAVVLDEDIPLSRLAWNWPDAGPPNDVAVALNESSWQKEDFEWAMEDNFEGIEANGYGASTGQFTGMACHVALHVVTGNDIIMMKKSNCINGDSGGAVWSLNPDGSAKLVGMVNWRGEWNLSGDNIMVTFDYVLPAWVLREFVADMLV